MIKKLEVNFELEFGTGKSKKESIEEIFRDLENLDISDQFYKEILQKLENTDWKNSKTIHLIYSKEYSADFYFHPTMLIGGCTIKKIS